jgi:hypothetical protein
VFAPAAALDVDAAGVAPPVSVLPLAWGIKELCPRFVAATLAAAAAAYQ